MTDETLTTLSDSDLLATVRLAAAHEREATSKLVALLAEVDSRRLYLGEGYSSMFAFCTRALRMSEHAAYSRIEAARLAKRFPAILGMLADGRWSLTNLGLLAPHLDEENCDALFEAARHQSKRDVERLIAVLHPQPDIPATVRALPVSVPAKADGPRPVRDEVPRVAPSGPVAATFVSAAQTSTVVAPIAPRRFLLRVTIGEETQQRLERARDLLRHDIPDGDPAAIIDRALALLVADVERRKFAATKRSAAARPSWSFTTSSRLRWVGQVPPKTSNCVAGRTTNTRLNASAWRSGHRQCRRRTRSGPRAGR